MQGCGGNVFFKVHFSEVFLSKVHFCEMYPTCVSSKLCEFISLFSSTHISRRPCLSNTAQQFFLHILSFSNTQAAGTDCEDGLCNPSNFLKEREVFSVAGRIDTPNRNSFGDGRGPSHPKMKPHPVRRITCYARLFQNKLI